MSNELKVEIQSTEVDEFSGTSKAGRPFHIRKQQAYLFRPGEQYPDRFQVRLEDNQPPYTPGHYMVDMSSVRVSRYGELEFGVLKLTPASTAKVKAA